MTRLILTTTDSGAGCLKQTGIADAVLPFGHRFSGPLPSEAEITDSLTAPSQHEQSDDDWLSRIYSKYLREIDSSTALVDLCEQFDVVDLWIDPDPNAQLILIWLLDYFRPHKIVASKMNLVQADVPIGYLRAEELDLRRIPAIKLANEHFDIAGSAREAYRAPTPRDWFSLLSNDLNALPRPFVRR
jgi:hypothetical protein